MTAEKRQEPSSARSAGAAPAATGTPRKPWVRRSNVDVILASIEKQERRVADMEADLMREKRELEKLLAAKKVLEGK